MNTDKKQCNKCYKDYKWCLYRKDNICYVDIINKILNDKYDSNDEEGEK